MNSLRKSTAFGAMALVVLALFVIFVLPALAQGQSGTTLSATVDVTSHWTRTFHWTIDKSVTPDTLNLFRGDSGKSQYTIAVTKDSGIVEAWVDGQVCVTNGGAVATENLTIEAILQNGYGPPNDFLTSAPVDVSNNPVLDPGETGCYNYRVNIPITDGAFPQPHANGSYKVTANVTITNHSGHLGVPFGPSPSATTVFLANPTPINDTIHVDDTNGGSWMFNASGTQSYDKTFSCDGDAGKHDNTATIQETGQSDSASVTVNCYALEVTKNASTSFKRTYNWTIDKSADKNALTLATGEQFLVNYSVKVDATYTDSDWAVNGNIAVKNPAPIAATINSVSDVVSPDIVATVNCGVSFPYSLAAGGTLKCIYSADLPDASSRTNTATAILQNTPNGTTNFSSDKVSVDFSTATITEVDKCVDVSDTYAGSLGTVCYSDLPKTFTYSRWIGPYDVCGDYTVENTASFVTNNTKTTGSDRWTVAVHVPCVGGCTLTQGYWKTHNESFKGGAPIDDTWELVGPTAEQTVFDNSGQSWFQVFWTAPKGGNVWYQLAHQWMAAKLNILNGADPLVVETIMDTAFGWLSNHSPNDNLKGNDAKNAQNWASKLDQYNNGLIGPGHCSE